MFKVGQVYRYVKESDAMFEVKITHLHNTFEQALCTCVTPNKNTGWGMVGITYPITFLSLKRDFVLISSKKNHLPEWL